MRHQGLQSNRARFSIPFSRLLIACTSLIAMTMTSLVQAKPIAEVKVIHASRAKSPKVSANLKAISPRLKSTFKHFNHFKSLSERKIDLGDKKQHSIKIFKDVNVRLQLVEQKGRNIELEVSAPKRRIKHRVKARLGRLFFEAIKWHGQVYLLAIRPRA